LTSKNTPENLINDQFQPFPAKPFSGIIGVTLKAGMDKGAPVMSQSALQVTGSAPAEQVPVAFLGRTSTLLLQDPTASLRRQAREVQAKLPPGWFIAAWFWDIERLPASAAEDIARREQEIARLHKRLRKIDAAETAHAREIENLASLPQGSPAITALRTRIIERFGELETERAQINSPQHPRMSWLAQRRQSP
jgi:hypothetical protein